MQILQWSMTIPIDKQEYFVKWFHEVAGSAFAKFGAKKHELCKVEDKEIIGKQLLEKNRFIERVFFEDDFDLASYFSKVKDDPEASKMSRMYEDVFGASDIELRILKDAH